MDVNTVLVTTNMLDGERLKLFAIGKSKTPECFKAPFC